jgi:hypothetical protein
VEKTSTEISIIRTDFESKLTTIQTSVDDLTTKVEQQYNEINTTVQSLVDTIAKQNFIIAGIQQDFKLSLESLTKTILPSKSSAPIPSSTSIQWRSIGDK